MTTAIIQARMGATRLPGKVMKMIVGKTVLEHVVDRVRRAKTIERIVVATTVNPQDDAIAAFLDMAGIPYYRGSEDDVLDRYYQSAALYHANPVVRITADCPLMDPAVIDRVVHTYLSHTTDYEYVSNVRPPTFPDGMDVEVFSFAVLEKFWREAHLASEREHVTAYIGNHPELFRIGNVRNDVDQSPLRLTLDTSEDLLLIQKIFEALYPANPAFTLSDIVVYLSLHPNLLAVNQHMERNEGYKKSLAEDHQV